MRDQHRDATPRVNPSDVCHELIFRDPTEVELSAVAPLMNHMDLDDLNSLFRKLLHNHGFGYSLFGSKPIAQTEFLGPNYRADRHSTDEEQLFNEQHFPTPQDYFALCRCMEFIKLQDFRLHESEDAPDGQRAMSILNLPLVRQTIRENEELFFGAEKTGSADSLISAMLQSKVLKNGVGNREDRMGVLHGFGVENSLAYARWQKLKDPSSTTERPIARADIRPLPGFFTAQEELQDLARQLALDQQAAEEGILAETPERSDPVKRLQFFGLCNHPETLRLQAANDAMHRGLTTFCSSDNWFLEKILIRLSQ